MWKTISSTRWFRLAIVVSVIWLLLGTAFYVNSLGIHVAIPDYYGYWDLPAPLAWWAVVSSNIGIPVFDFSPRFSAGFYVAMPFELQFYWLGFLVFIGGPLLFWWFIIIATMWVCIGGKASSNV